MGPYVHRCIDTLHGILESEAAKNPEGFDITPYVDNYLILAFVTNYHVR